MYSLKHKLKLQRFIILVCPFCAPCHSLLLSTLICSLQDSGAVKSEAKADTAAAEIRSETAPVAAAKTDGEMAAPAVKAPVGLFF